MPTSTEDEMLEQKWEELKHLPFYRLQTTGELVLFADWWIFKAKTGRKEIWLYFDQHHSKGIGYLTGQNK